MKIPSVIHPAPPSLYHFAKFCPSNKLKKKRKGLRNTDLEYCYFGSVKLK